jgi:hypothetical protein
MRRQWRSLAFYAHQSVGSGCVGCVGCGGSVGSVGSVSVGGRSRMWCSVPHVKGRW